ncbi:MAG: hypothetical protein WAV47_24610 [Blastocatellia bacterium]
MKECPTCRRFFPDQNSFCSYDGLKLIRSVQNTDELQEGQGQRQIPPPPNPIPLRVTIIDQGDEGHRSRKIDGLALDFGKQGMRIQTGTIETGQLHIIRDHTVAFKNKLEVEVDLPNSTVQYTGFAAWYRPEAEGLFWVVGVYIRDMAASDRQAYDEYLKLLTRGADADSQSAPA